MLIARTDERILAGAGCAVFSGLFYVLLQLIQFNWIAECVSNSTSLKVLLAIEGCAVILYILWTLDFLPNYAKYYILLASALLSSPVLFAGVSLKTTVELRHPIDHIREETEFVIRLTECFAQEARTAINASRRALLEERHVQSVIQGIRSVKQTFDSLSQSSEEFRKLIVSSLTWLDQRGISCDAMASAPYRSCISVCSEARKDCSMQLVADAAFFCHITKVCDAFCNTVKGLAEVACSNMVQNALTNLDRYKATLKEVAVQHTSLRAAFQFSLNVTTNVQDHYVSQWETLKISLDQQRKSVAAVMQVILDILKIAIPCVILVYPFWYALLFRYGSNDFQNDFIDSDLEQYQPSCVFPLQPHEAVKYLLMNQWRLKWVQYWSIIRRFAASVFLIAVVLSVDWIWTSFVRRLHHYLRDFFEAFDGKIFTFQRVPASEGMGKIVNIFVELLEKMQSAADVSRTRHCFSKMPPAVPYSYYPFLLSVVVLFALIWITKQCNLSVMICSRFDRDRHLERHLYKKNRILMERVETNSF